MQRIASMTRPFAVVALLAVPALALPGFIPSAAAQTNLRYALPDGHLYFVAATSARSGWAVGQSVSGKTLIMRWNGKAWAMVPSNVQAKGNLVGVAATSASNAWAVGYASSPLILHWNGKSWKKASIPALGKGAQILAVTATSAGNAWAVGSTGEIPFQNGHTLILHWNGRTWAHVRSPGPYFTLESVAATSRRNAWAVGCTCGPGGGDSFSAHWNGATWKKIPSPNPGGRYNALYSVAVTSRGTVWSVGDWDLGNLVLRWTGRTWHRGAGPKGRLTSIAAVPGTGTLWLIGQQANGKPLVARRTATSWMATALPPSLGENSELNSIAATSDSNAWTVGVTGTGRALILHWNGKSWKAQ